MRSSERMDLENSAPIDRPRFPTAEAVG